MIGAIILTTCLMFRGIIRYFFAIAPQKSVQKGKSFVRSPHFLVTNSMLFKVPLLLKASSFKGLSIITYAVLTPSSNGSPIGLGDFLLAFGSAVAIVGSLQSQGARQAAESLL
jgi:hypothetical protein